jgi:hypothetical protein
MLKITGLCLFLLLYTASANSQGKYEYGLQVGIGINGARKSNIPNEFRGMIAGFNIGGQLKINQTRHFGLKTILQYEQHGFMYKDVTVEYPGNTTGKANIHAKLNYIDLKILPVVTLGGLREVSFYAGPTAGILVANKLVTKFKDPLPQGYENSQSSKGDKRKIFNAGLAIGISSMLNIAPKIKAGFDIRYDRGFTNVFKNGEARLGTVSFSPALVVSF